MTSPTRVRAWLLDIDGTLVDSTYAHVVSWDLALREHGLTVPLYRIHRAIGMGSDKLLSELVGDTAAAAVGESATTRHRELFLEQADRLRPTEGAVELIEELVRRGAPVVFASSAGPAERDALLEVLALQVEVTAVTTSEDVEESKPATDLLQVALDRAGAEPADAVMIGDATWDMKAARKAGVRGVGVLTGGIGRDELTEAGAEHVFSNPHELLEQLDQLF